MSNGFCKGRSGPGKKGSFSETRGIRGHQFADARFIEERRKALTRFLTLIVRHPILSDDKIVLFFLSYNGPEMQYKLRDEFRNVPDEFLINNVATKKD